LHNSDQFPWQPTKFPKSHLTFPDLLNFLTFELSGPKVGTLNAECCPEYQQKLEHLLNQYACSSTAGGHLAFTHIVDF